MTTRWKTLVLVIAMGSIGAGPAATAQAPPPTPALTPAPAQESRTTDQLLLEVRALRAAIERMTVSGTRAQLLLGRLQMQEQRMTTLGRQLQESRTKLTEALRQRQSHVLEVEHLTAAIERASTPDERIAAETGLNAARAAMKQFDQQVNALQTDDASIAQALTTEQNRWIELNGRLEELENLLATPKL
jgi:chromosome segregation ATPase